MLAALGLRLGVGVTLALVLAVLGLALRGAHPAGEGAPAAAAPQGTGPDPVVTGGPGRAEPDLFHPDHQPNAKGVRPPLPPVRDGGTVVVHMNPMPRHFNFMTESTSVTRWVLFEVHEFLLQRDWSTWEFVPRLAERMDREDAVRLTSGERIYGRVSEQGAELLVTPVSPGNPLEEPRRVARADVESVLEGTVFTFRLHDGVRWHDGEPLDAEDVWFSWRSYFNDFVDCKDKREQIRKLAEAEIVDDRTIRFFYAEQYFLALESFENLCILPAHVYDLSDPENPDYDPDVDPLGQAQGEYVNRHPANLNWIGLGPYRIDRVDERGVEAVRVRGYFDPERAGHVERIRWRHIADDNAAKTALLNGELDYFARLSSADLFGGFCGQPSFSERLYTAFNWVPKITYVAWNTRRPQLADPAVRRALAHCFDWPEYVTTMANGLGVQITAAAYYLGPFYDHGVQPYPYDLGRARELLDDAGWYDRDGDGVRDKDGVPLTIEFLAQAGNLAALGIGQRLQENLGRVGVRLEIASREYAALKERLREKDFDAANSAWTLDVENDPAYLWASWDGDGPDRSANYAGIADREVDELIDRIQHEIDPARRVPSWHRLHARIYELQPYLFGYMVPDKMAVARRVRNFRAYGINPGYSIRDWYLVE